MSTARARTRSAYSGVERTNHEATAPPTLCTCKLIPKKPVFPSLFLQLRFLLDDWIRLDLSVLPLNTSHESTMRSLQAQIPINVALHCCHSGSPFLDTAPLIQTLEQPTCCFLHWCHDVGSDTANNERKERQILLHCIQSKEEEVCLTCQHTPTPNEQIVCMLQIAKIWKGKRSSHKTFHNKNLRQNVAW